MRYLILMLVLFLTACRESIFYVDDNSKNDISLYEKSGYSVNVQLIGLSDGIECSFYVKNKKVLNNSNHLNIFSLNAKIENIFPDTYSFMNYCSAKIYRNDTLQQIIKRGIFDTCNLSVISCDFKKSDILKSKLKFDLSAQIVDGHDTVNIVRVIWLKRKIERGVSIH